MSHPIAAEAAYQAVIQRLADQGGFADLAHAQLRVSYPDLGTWLATVDLGTFHRDLVPSSLNLRATLVDALTVNPNARLHSAEIFGLFITRIVHFGAKAIFADVNDELVRRAGEGRAA